MIEVPGLGVNGFFELVEEGDLCGIDAGAGGGEREPGSFIYFREGLLFTGAAGPFQFKCITGEGCGIEVAGGGPGEDAFAAFLANGAQRLEGTLEDKAGLLPELADSGVQRRFVVGELPFGDGPAAGIFFLPVGAAGMHQEYLEEAILATV